MKSLVLSFLGAMVLLGCATEGKIKGPVNAREVAVEAGKNKFSPGDRVSIFQEKCEEKNTAGGEKHGGSRRICRDTKIGSGEIVRRVSEKEVILRADGTVVLSEGLEVKKE